MEGECNVLHVRINNLDENLLRLNEKGEELEDELEKTRLGIEQNGMKLIDLKSDYDKVYEKINERLQILNQTSRL